MSYHFRLKGFALLFVLFSSFLFKVFAQTAPSIDYGSARVLLRNSAVSPAITPVNSGGAIPSATYLQTSLLAGSTRGDVDGTGAAAKINRPEGITIDAAGNVYIADTWNHIIRKITPAGVVTVLAGTGDKDFLGGGYLVNNTTGTLAKFDFPTDLVVHPDGSCIYVADKLSHVIRRISLTSPYAVTTFAGSGTSGFADHASDPSLARFDEPQGIAYDGSGSTHYLYVADRKNHRIRRITLSGTSGATATATSVSNFAGTGTTGSTEGAAIGTARFDNPIQVAVSANGSIVYVTDFGNNKVRKIEGGTVSTLAGSGASGSADGTGASATFKGPSGIEFHGSGDLIVTEFNGNLIRRITPAGVVTTLAGSSTAGTLESTGTSARFDSPTGLVFDTDDAILYICDYGNERIRKMNMSGYILSPSLPTGLSMNAGTGAITGTPTTLAAASNFTITGYNYYGSAAATLNLTISNTPTVSTTTASSVTTTTASSGGNVTDEGGATVIARGLVWGTVESPTVSLATKTTDGTGTGSFSSSITGLTPGTTYYYRAYATNGAGTGYGTTSSFTTAETAPSISYPSASYDFAVNSAITPLTVTNTGGSPASLQVSLLAGQFQGHADGTGTAAKFQDPRGIALDVDGNLIVADASQHVIRRVTPMGVATTIAGLPGTSGFIDATGSAARFNGPIGVAVDPDNNIYVSDKYNNAIRKITPAGVVSTIAGSATWGTADGTGSSARFWWPGGITYAPDGKIYIADYSNNRIRSMTTSGVVTTLAGNTMGFANGTGTSASFYNPSGLTADQSGNLYVADFANRRVRKIVISSGLVTSIAGNGTAAVVDGTGTDAQFHVPWDLCMLRAGYLLVADRDKNIIRKVTPSGVVTTVFGQSGVYGSTNGTGTSATLWAPNSIVEAPNGNIYVTESSGKIKLISKYTIEPALPAGLILDPSTGTISGTPTATIAPKLYTVKASNSAGTSTLGLTIGIAGAPTVTVDTASFVSMNGATINGTVNAGGNTTSAIVVKYSTNQSVVDAGNGTSMPATSQIASGFTSTPVQANLTGLAPSTVYYYRVHATNGVGTGSSETKSFTTTNAPPSISYGSSSYTFSTGTAISPMTVTNTGGAVDLLQVSTFAGSGIGGLVDGTGTAARIYEPVGINTDAAGNIYVGEYGSHAIRKITPTGVVTTLAGTFSIGTDDGIGSAAKFYHPMGLVHDGVGNLYIADNWNNRIRKLNLSNNEVTTLAGNTKGFNDGSGTSALFSSPCAIVLDNDGNLYVTDNHNYRIRKITSSSAVSTYAGTQHGLADGVGTLAKLVGPLCATKDGSGNMYFTEPNRKAIRKLEISTATVTTVSSSSTTGVRDGLPGTLSYTYPAGLALDGLGNLYIAELTVGLIRRLNLSTGELKTIAGSTAGFTDGIGTAAKFNRPYHIVFDPSGNLFISDMSNNRIRRISKFMISPALPAGLTFNTATGEILGTPTTTAAATTYTVTASNFGGTHTTSFTLEVTSAIITTAASAITETTATSGGNVDATAYAGATQKGVCWNTSGTPTISNSRTTEGSGTGTFTSSLTGLSPNTTYYIRSYVTVGGTTSYGAQRTFKTNQLGTFANVSKTFGDAKFSLTAPTAVSTGSFIYSSSNTGVATLTGKEVTIVGAGTTTITATQAAAGAYASVSRTMTLTVAKATPSITLNIPTTTTLAAANNMSITASASNGETVTVAIGSGTATGTLNTVSGGYELNGVSASGNLVFNATTAATPNWEAGSKTVTMDVQKNSQTIGFTLSSPVTYSSGLSIPLTATSTTGSGTATGLTVGFSVVSGTASVSGSNLEVTSPGVIVVRASQSGNSTYNPAPAVDRTLTVNPGAPTITGFTPASATEGDVVTISGTNFHDVNDVKFGGTAATSFTVVSSTSITAVVGSGHTGSVSVTTTGGTDTEAGFRYKVIWTGATNAFNQTGNWTGGRVPQTDDDIIFSPTAASDLDLDGHKTVGNVDFNGSGRSLKLGAYNLTVKGNLTMPGNISGSGKVIMSGTAAQTIRGGGDIPDLEIASSGGVSIDAAGDEITVSGTLRSTSGTLTTNGKLRLTSNSGGTARVDVVSGTISGNVIAERYIQRNNNSDGTGRAWRLVSVPVTGTGTLREFFMNGRSGQDLTNASVVLNETENSGTPIVGHNYATASEATTAGFDWIGVANSVSSLRSYVGNTAGGSFLSENVPSLSTTYAAADQGYMVFARGDRKLDFPSTTSSGATTFRSTGSLKTGPQTVSVAPASTSKYTLVGNPYMSVLNLDAFYTTNSAVINPSFWIWDANISGIQKQGGYINVYKSGTQWVTNTGTYVNPELLESGMAFFVEPVSSLPSATNISILESHKSNAASAGLSPFSTDKPDDHGRMYVRLERSDAKGQRQIIDGVMADFHTSQKVALTDMSDREKLRNGISRGALWIPRDGKLLSGEGLPWPTEVKRSIPLSMSGVGDQTLLVHINPTGMRDRYVAAWLKDNILKREIEINMSQPTDYDFIGTGRSDWDSTRFEIVYVEAGRPGTGVTLEPDEVAETPSVKLYPNPSKTAEVKLSLRAMAPGAYTVQVLDMTGRLVATSTLEHRSVNGEYRVLSGRLLSQGQYLVRLIDADKQLKETLRMMVE
jgi:sugar lactone lactonase YvrE